ncbi:MAG: AraC family transcriptional regulator [Bacteroidetes bacterium]|nr:AraC family transcriptional regulator [Bacteroidota bacterium]
MTTQLDEFKVIGISVRTTNENGQAMKDIPFLWDKFFTENISEKISNKLSDDLYCVYTHYEKDHTKPYTTILGYKVDVNEPIPEGLVAKSIDATNYKRFTASGKLSEGIVFKEWQNIWNLNDELNRSFTSDFEIYGTRSQNPEQAEVDIYIALN